MIRLLWALAAVSVAVGCGGRSDDETARLRGRLAQLEAQQQLANVRLDALETSGSAAPRSRPLKSPVSIDGLPFKGVEGAKVVIIEFGDYQCPYCRQHANGAEKELDKAFIRTGRVRYVFANLPLANLHPAAVRAAAAADCAMKWNKFWPLHDALFLGGPVTIHSVDEAAATAGLSSSDYKSCVESGADGRVQRQIEYAYSIGITSTPTFLLGFPETATSVRVVQRIDGVRSFDDFSHLIESLPERPAGSSGREDL